MWLEKDGNPISFWHDVPLYPDEEDKSIIHYYTEIPRWTDGKIETKRNEPLSESISSINRAYTETDCIKKTPSSTTTRTTSPASSPAFGRTRRTLSTTVPSPRPGRIPPTSTSSRASPATTIPSTSSTLAASSPATSARSSAPRSLVAWP